MLNQSHALQNQGVRAIYGRRESTGDSPRPNLCFKSFDQCYPSYAVLLTGLSRLRHHVSVPTDAPTQQSQDYHWTTASAAGAASVTALWYTAPGCATLQHCTLILRSWHSCSFRASIKDFITGALHQRSLVTLDCFHTDVDLYTQFPCYLSISIHRCDPSIPFSSLELVFHTPSGKSCFKPHAIGSRRSGLISFRFIFPLCLACRAQDGQCTRMRSCQSSTLTWSTSLCEVHA